MRNRQAWLAAAALLAGLTIAAGAARWAAADDARPQTRPAPAGDRATSSERTALTAPFALAPPGLVAGAGVLGSLALLLALSLLRIQAPAAKRPRDEDGLNRLLVESAPQALLCVDGEGTLRAVNPAAERLFGYAPGKLTGRSLLALLAGPHRGQLAAALERLGRGEAPHLADVPSRLTGLRRNGTEFALELTLGEAVLDGEPVLTGVARALKAPAPPAWPLETGHPLLQAVFDAIPTPFYLKDLDGRYRLVNRTMAAQHNLAPEAMVGQRVGDLPYRTAEEVARMEAADRRVLEHGESVELPAIAVRLADGAEAWQRQIKAPFHDAEGRVVGIVGMALNITEQKQAEDELRSNSHLMDTILNALPLPVALKDREGHYAFVNRLMAEQDGMTAAAMQDATVEQLPHRTPDERQRTVEADRRVLEHGEVVELPEVSVHLADGRTVWRRVVKTPIRDAEGNIVGLVASGEDITERKRAVDELRASQRLLQTVFDTIPFPLTVKDRESRYLMVNRGWLTNYGFTAEQALHHHTLEMETRPREDREDAYARDQRVLAGQEAMVVEDMWRTTAAGERRRLRTYKTALRNDEGELIGIVSANVDITDATLKEEALRASQRLLRTVVDTIPHTVVTKDVTGHYVMVNRAWLEFYGLTEAEVVGKHTLDLAYKRPLADLEAALEADREALGGNGAPRIAEHVRTNRHGERRYLQDIRVPLRDERGETTGLVAFAMDITERRMAEQRLRDTMRHVALVQRVAIASNEAATPEDAMRVCLRELCETMGWPLGHVYLPGPEGPGRLTPSDLWYPDDPERFAQFRAITARTTFLAGEGLPGEVLQSRAPAWIEDLAASGCIRTCQLSEPTVLAGFALPVLVGSEVAGVVEFFSERREPVQPELMDVLAQIGAQLGRVVERHRTAAELRASEERFRNLIEGSIQGVLIIRDYRPLFANQAYADILGYDSPEDVLANWTHEAMFPPHELPRMRAYHAARMRGEEAPTSYDVQARRRDGTEIWLETNARQINWNGQPATQITTTDVTERKRAEDALRASEERFRNLIEGSLQGVAIHVEGVPLFVNEAFARIHAYDSPEAIMALPNLEALVDPEDRPVLLEGQQQAIRSGRGAESQVQVTGVQRDGRRIELEAFFQAIDWQGQRAVQVTVTDVSDRVRLEDQLRQAQKMEAVGQLAGGVAHDFNNILQIIRGYTELAHGMAEDERAAGYLDKVLKAAEGASHLIRQLLALSRREMLRPRPLDMNRLITDLMEMVRRVIGEDIQLDVRSEAAMAVVQGDAALLEQVLLNLCVNARDAMPAGGRLVIETSSLHAGREFSRLHGWCPEGRYVVVSVSDTGVGIAPEDREHIFEPFFTTKEAGKGSGLGLSMAYGIVQQHQGLMEVESRQGLGTTFRVYLPASQSVPDHAPGWEHSEAPGGTETVLVAEDEAAVLNLVVQLLEGAGYTVLKAVDGEDALRVFEANADTIQLAILDVVMPRKSGRTVYTTLRERRPDLPILFSTGYSADALDPDFVREHSFYIIRKPYSPQGLYNAVRTALDAPWPPPPGATYGKPGSGESEPTG